MDPSVCPLHVRCWIGFHTRGCKFHLYECHFFSRKHATFLDWCQGKRIVVDRCNVTRLQRRVWLGVADENKAGGAREIWRHSKKQQKKVVLAEISMVIILTVSVLFWHSQYGSGVLILFSLFYWSLRHSCLRWIRGFCTETSLAQAKAAF